MAINFDTYLVRPLLPGGTGQVKTAVRVDGDTLERVIVKVGAAQATAWSDPNFLDVDVPMGDAPGDGSLIDASFTGAIVAVDAVASWFAKLTTGGWVTGPVVTGIDLTAKYDSQFPWLKSTVVSLLKQLYADNPIDLQDGRSLQIRGAFPRDSFALPSLSVQVTAVPTGIQLVNDSDASGVLVGAKVRKVRGYNLNIDMISWTDNPEERELIAPWLGSALAVLVDTIPHFGGHEPTYSVNESEDFDTLKVPAFLVTGSLNFTALSDLSYPVPTSYGHLTLIQEAP